MKPDPFINTERPHFKEPQTTIITLVIVAICFGIIYYTLQSLK